MVHLVPQKLLDATFSHFRTCGRGRECQVLWTSPWTSPNEITGVVHPKHRAHAGGFDIDSRWLNTFWLQLAQDRHGVRIQVHTHPYEAFHSPTDDAYPMIHTPGFLSLVIPRFAQGPISFQDAFLAELGSDGQFREVALDHHLKVVPWAV